MKSIFSFLLIIQFLTVFAQLDTINYSKKLGIYTDEDFYPILIRRNLAKDQNYTMGFGFNWNEQSSSIFIKLRKLGNKYLAKKRSFSRIDFESDNEINTNKNIFYTKSSLSINGAAFTPDSIQLTTISMNDRPYSFLLTLNSSQIYFDSSFTKCNNFSLNFGIYGTRIGEIVQTAIHKTMNKMDSKDPHNPKGWPHQINDGFTPTFMYSLKKYSLISKSGIEEMMEKTFFDSYKSIEYMFGYYTGISVEYSFRVGILDPRNWNIRFNTLENVDKGKESDQTKSLKDYIKIKKKGELFCYFTAKPSLILFNQSLSGVFFSHSDYKLKPILEANPFILNASLGIGATLPDRMCNSNKFRYWSIGWVPIAVRTPEMWGSKISRFHYWGGLYINCIY